MIMLIAILISSGLVAVAITTNWLWSYKKIISVIMIGVVTFISLWLLIFNTTLWMLALVLTSFYVCFNLYRLAYSQLQHDNLKRICRTTALRLIMVQLAVLIISLMINNNRYINGQRWLIVSIFDLGLASLLTYSTMRHIKITKKIKLATQLTDNRAPTLTVAIPARNETDSLYECLVSLLACNYPKLEVLVLDDNSTIKRTPEIIRSFAHDGVIFVAGKPLKQDWLAKNWAYQQLLEAANGDLILFCGADTRFSPEALRFLVFSLESRNKLVISVLPKNIKSSVYMANFLQPIRYAWEICLPRRPFNRPPVLSTCWLAQRQFLLSIGGFKAVSKRVVCESYFARQSLAKDGYSFFQYDGVIAAKTLNDLLETGVRLRYPQLNRQPELVALISLIEIFFIIGSVIVLLFSLLNGLNIEALISGLAVILFGVTNGLVYRVTYRRDSLSGFLVWPMALLIDLWLLHMSMFRYEFGQILWKGRNVNYLDSTVKN